jgi:hypothetical protein
MKPTSIIILTSATLAVGNVVHIKPDTSLSAPDTVTTLSTVNTHDVSPDQASDIDYAEILSGSSSSDFVELAEDSSKKLQKYKDAEYKNPEDEDWEQDDDHQNHPRGGGGGGGGSRCGGKPKCGLGIFFPGGINSAVSLHIPLSAAVVVAAAAGEVVVGML